MQKGLSKSERDKMESTADGVAFCAAVVSVLVSKGVLSDEDVAEIQRLRDIYIAKLVDFAAGFMELLCQQGDNKKEIVRFVESFSESIKEINVLSAARLKELLRECGGR